jgi:hypothetical protein
MIQVGLIDATWPMRLPPPLAERLQSLLDTGGSLNSSIIGGVSLEVGRSADRHAFRQSRAATRSCTTNSVMALFPLVFPAHAGRVA